MNEENSALLGYIFNLFIMFLALLTSLIFFNNECF